MSIKVGRQHEAANWRFAVDYAASVLRNAKDWQEAQHALADHPTIGPWLRGNHPLTDLAVVEAIIRDAEKQLGDELPY